MKEVDVLIPVSERDTHDALCVLLQWRYALLQPSFGAGHRVSAIRLSARTDRGERLPDNTVLIRYPGKRRR